MASVVTHAFLGAALGKAFSWRERPLKFWIFSIVCSILPDVDVISLYMGIPYGDVFGHRGFFHSFFFAFVLSFLVMVLGFKDSPKFSKSWWSLWLFFFLLISTHGLLDALTNGGLGVAFFSPFDETRYFFPWTPLKVSPIGWRGFFSPWGREVIMNEIIWVWVPSVLVLGASRGCRMLISPRGKSVSSPSPI